MKFNNLAVASGLQFLSRNEHLMKFNLYNIVIFCLATLSFANHDPATITNSEVDLEPKAPLGQILVTSEAQRNQIACPASNTTEPCFKLDNSSIKNQHCCRLVSESSATLSGLVLSIRERLQQLALDKSKLKSILNYIHIENAKELCRESDLSERNRDKSRNDAAIKVKTEIALLYLEHFPDDEVPERVSCLQKEEKPHRAYRENAKKAMEGLVCAVGESCGRGASLAAEVVLEAPKIHEGVKPGNVVKKTNDVIKAAATALTDLGEMAQGMFGAPESKAKEVTSSQVSKPRSVAEACSAAKESLIKRKAGRCLSLNELENVALEKNPGGMCCIDSTGEAFVQRWAVIADDVFKAVCEMEGPLSDGEAAFWYNRIESAVVDMKKVWDQEGASRGVGKYYDAWDKLLSSGKRLTDQADKGYVKFLPSASFTKLVSNGGRAACESLPISSLVQKPEDSAIPKNSDRVSGSLDSSPKETPTVADSSPRLSPSLVTAPKNEPQVVTPSTASLQDKVNGYVAESTRTIGDAARGVWDSLFTGGSVASRATTDAGNPVMAQADGLVKKEPAKPVVKAQDAKPSEPVVQAPEKKSGIEEEPKVEPSAPLASPVGKAEEPVAAKPATRDLASQAGKIDSAAPKVPEASKGTLPENGDENRTARLGKGSSPVHGTGTSGKVLEPAGRPSGVLPQVGFESFGTAGGSRGFTNFALSNPSGFGAEESKVLFGEREVGEVSRRMGKVIGDGAVGLLEKTASAVNNVISLGRRYGADGFLVKGARPMGGDGSVLALGSNGVQSAGNFSPSGNFGYASNSGTGSGAGSAKGLASVVVPSGDAGIDQMLAQGYVVTPRALAWEKEREKAVLDVAGAGEVLKEEGKEEKGSWVSEMTLAAMARGLEGLDSVVAPVERFVLEKVLDQMQGEVAGDSERSLASMAGEVSGETPVVGKRKIDLKMPNGKVVKLKSSWLREFLRRIGLGV